MLLIDALCEQKNKALIPLSCFQNFFATEDGEIDVKAMEDAFLALYKHDLLDYTFTKSKTEQFVLIELNKKGINFNADVKRERKKVYVMVLKTVLLAILSFVVTLILRQIF